MAQAELRNLKAGRVRLPSSPTPISYHPHGDHEHTRAHLRDSRFDRAPLHPAVRQSPSSQAVYQQRSGVLLLSSRDEALRNVDEQLALASAVEPSGRLPKGF